jgi:hypothetical protein
VEGYQRIEFTASATDQAEHGIRQICDSDSLVMGFLAHTGLSLNENSSP